MRAVRTTRARPSVTAAVRVILGLAMLLGVLCLTSDANAEVAPTACTKTLGGTLRGEDGRYLSAFVGVVFYDSGRRPIATASCSRPKTGYDGTDSLNDTGGCCYLIDAAGASSGEETWAIKAPGNAAYAWVEAYPKGRNTVNGPHQTTWERYGGAMRRYVAVTPNLHLRLPLGCGLGPGGDNGSIRGKILRRGAPVATTEIAAWSRAPDGPSPIMGFGEQTQPGTSDGRFNYTQLPPGQRYALRITVGGTYYWFEHDYGTGIPVSACRATSVSIDIGYSPPRLKYLPGASTVGVRRGTQMLLTNSTSGGAPALDFQFGQSADRILVGDWNGDGVDTVGVQRGRQFILTNSTTGGGPYTSFTYGVDTDVAVVGDWDGNGTDTIGIRRGNAYFLRNSNSGGSANITFAYGTTTDTPVVGDWDGNGTSTPGIRRGNAYFLRNSNTSGPAHLTFAYGTTSDVPIVGDWDGNRTDTPGIRRGNSFYLRNSNSSGAANLTFAYGTATDTPVVGDWDGS